MRSHIPATDGLGCLNGEAAASFGISASSRTPAMEMSVPVPVRRAEDAGQFDFCPQKKERVCVGGGGGVESSRSRQTSGQGDGDIRVLTPHLSPRQKLVFAPQRFGAKVGRAHVRR